MIPDTLLSVGVVGWVEWGGVESICSQLFEDFHILAPLTSISFRFSAGIRLSENNNVPCQHEILHD